MPYRTTQFLAGECYHIYNRGNNRERTFFERENYAFFLRQLRQYITEPVVDVVAYCLMPNHYHLILQLRADDLSNSFQAFSLSYTKAINKQHERVGSLFQGPFKAIHIETDQYLTHLSRYIHLNPVIAGLVGKAEDWEFSSYREYVGLRQGTLPKPGLVMSQFAGREAYRAFVEKYVEDDRKMIEDLLLE
jgi:REP element-mobilizing transposase RayT